MKQPSAGGPAAAMNIPIGRVSQWGRALFFNSSVERLSILNFVGRNFLKKVPSHTHPQKLQLV